MMRLMPCLLACSLLGAADYTFDGIVGIQADDGSIRIEDARDRTGIVFAASSVQYVLPWDRNDNNSYATIMLHDNPVDHKVRIRKRGNEESWNFRAVMAQAGTTLNAVESAGRTILWNRDRFGVVEFGRGNLIVLVKGTERIELR